MLEFSEGNATIMSQNAPASSRGHGYDLSLASSIGRGPDLSLASSRGRGYGISLADILKLRPGGLTDTGRAFQLISFWKTTC